MIIHVYHSTGRSLQFKKCSASEFPSLSSSNFLLKNPFLTSKINICPVGGGKNPWEVQDYRWSRRPESHERNRHSETNKTSKHHPVVWNHWDAQAVVPHYGICQWWRTLRLHRKETKVKGGRSLQVLLANHLWRRIPPRVRNRSQRLKAREFTARPRKEYQAGRLRPQQYIQARRTFENSLWVSLLCCAWND